MKAQLRGFGVTLAIGLSAIGCVGAPLDLDEEETGEVQQAEVGLFGNFTIFDANLARAGGVFGGVLADAFGGRTTAELDIRRAPPNKRWGAIAHVDSCRVNQGGARYRNNPAAGSSATNEIWLDVEIDASGRGTSRTVVNFVVPPNGAKSLVLYQNPAASGNVGNRIACINFPWGDAL
ncbi:hypothetical protein [Sorangium sp. So ce131]|uniref:hypothetical protein n=1 Tax=Sorangium sp. So ce131 TaxID=3133282 RepID=UPI003F611467